MAQKNGFRPIGRKPLFPWYHLRSQADRPCALVRPVTGAGRARLLHVQHACSQGNFALRPLGRLAAGDRRSLAKGAPSYFSCSSQINIYIIYSTTRGQIQGSFLQKGIFIRENPGAGPTSRSAAWYPVWIHRRPCVPARTPWVAAARSIAAHSAGRAGKGTPHIWRPVRSQAGYPARGCGPWGSTLRPGCHAIDNSGPCPAECSQGGIQSG